VLVADDAGIEDARGGGQRIDRRVDAQLDDRPRQVGRRVQVREGGRRRRVGVVVGGHINRLHRGDRPLLGRRDPLLQLAHLGEQRRLVADRGRHPAEERRDLRARLREAEDVVDEEENVLVLGVAEVLGDGQAAQRHAQARAGRLRHLAVDERRARLLHLVQVDDAALLELQPEIVSLAGPLADPGEHRDAAVLHRDVVNQLLDDDGLADTGAAEQPDLAAAQVRLQQVDDLDAGLEHLQLGGLLVQRRRGAVDRPALRRLHRAIREVHGLAEHVHDAPQRSRSHRHRDRRASVDRRHPPLHAVGRLHRHRPHPVLAEVLLHLADHVDDGSVRAGAAHLDGVVDRRQVAALELDVDDRTDDLNDLPRLPLNCCGCGHMYGYLRQLQLPRTNYQRTPNAQSPTGWELAVGSWLVVGRW
jgi:peptide chain release factor 1